MLVHPILTQSKFNQIPCTYVFEVCTCFSYFTIRYSSCSDGVVYLVIHVINQIMNAWKLTKNILYFIQYATLKYNHLEYQSFTYWSILFLAHLATRPGELLSSLFVCRLSSVVCRLFVNISHFNLLLRNHWSNCKQTLVEWSLDGPLPKLCPVIPIYNQDGRQAKNRKKGDEILIVHCCCSVSQNELKFYLQLHGKE